MRVHTDKDGCTKAERASCVLALVTKVNDHGNPAPACMTVDGFTGERRTAKRRLNRCEFSLHKTRHLVLGRVRL